MNDELQRPTASGDLRRAANVAQEMASAVRLNSLGAPTQGDHMLKLLVSLIGSRSETPADALAFAATARTLLPLAFASVNDAGERMATECVRHLIDRTIETLEGISGMRAETFTGAGPAVN
ncbi:hypothetical protein BPNPMPFG_005043 [Mesorhizobium sp. AR07]|uniref:hypothetical protein n=1 Tax=Mesorhizobium sp. AR07 TaxID=2865838 RepID=UPI0021607DD4|nr:hypothetical protein [Mesorhizobium sp. AR07]UVK43265.1 hypothetical protein BPNPMPFG_005043 [Mesorhizobium sp. AR07]